MTIIERRRFEWFLRYGVGMTLDAIGKEVGRSQEIVRTDLNILEAKYVLSWKSNKPRSELPRWWRRLRDANAFSGSFYVEVAPGWPRIPSMRPAFVRPMQGRAERAKEIFDRLKAKTNFSGPVDTGPHDDDYRRALRADEEEQQ